MPFTSLQRCPIDPAQAPVPLHYREAGSGPAVVLLHGGWGYEAYPFDRAFETLAAGHRVIAPDRVGYGRSGGVPTVRPERRREAPESKGERIRELPPGFHRHFAEETVLTLDALGIDSATLWGHSDGAVIAAWTAILFPDRVRALILEALHFTSAKVSSIEFFTTAVEAPERFGPANVDALQRDHGDRWRDVVGAGGRAWLRIIDAGRRSRRDLYDGRLSEIRAPTLLLHGRRDPRTEPGEIGAALAALPHATVEWFDASHSPHTGATSADACVAAAARFLEQLALRGSVPSEMR